MTTALPEALMGGFERAPQQSARAFRAVLEAMARPGSLQRLAGAAPPAPLSPAAGAVLLTLVDATTPLYLAGAADCALVREWVRFHLGAPLCGAEQASFALGRWQDLRPLNRFAIGSAEYPDRAATLIVEMDDLRQSGTTLRGPGIRQKAQLSLPETAAFQANHALYPLGFDCLFTCGDLVAGLPRSTLVEDC
jgi:alpha-D-ribose 1-methylphosphonate 5-triphosphate synthase subunit PhnH